MAAYVILVNLTDQGMRSVKETTKRARIFREMAGKAGVNVKEIYWTQGPYDLMAILEGPDEETMTALGLSIGSHGNIRTQTLRAFSAEEMDAIIGKMV